MKYYLCLAVFVGFLCSNCSRGEDHMPQITYNDSAYIKISAEIITDTIIVQTNFCSNFPMRGCFRKEVVIPKPGEYFIAYKMTKPEFVHFTIGKEFTTMLIPADTLVIKVGCERGVSKKQSPYYKINNDIYNYYQTKFKKFGYYTFMDDNKPGWNYWIKSVISESEYDKAIVLLDVAVKDNMNFLKENNKNLPEWFTNLEKANIIYGSVLTKIQFFRKANADRYSEKLTLKVAFNNPDASLSSLYYYFISEYLSLKYPLNDNNLSGAVRGINYFTKQERSIDSLLNGSIRNYYVTCKLSDLYAMFSNSSEDFALVDSFLKNKALNLTEQEIRYINQEKNFTKNVLKIKYKLEPGDKASGFYLKDENDIVHRLSDYQGKLVYLHFWTTWCEPCIKEIPAINQLYSKLVNKPIQIINVCLDDNVDTWKQIIARENFKGTNLICRGNWENSLKNKYFINVLPHYSIIDKKGLIIKNYCSGPTEIYNELAQLYNNK
jgi:thiol-disulfide isomerase/thioredoxin